MVKKAAKTAVTNEKILGFLVNMDERMNAIHERMATKDHVEQAKDEIMDVVKPISDAVDKDAKTVVNHGRRITVIERKVGIAAK